jgi:ribose 5-phosphate isomerase A
MGLSHLQLAERQRRAAECAVCYVESGMVVGLGSGATAAFAVRRIGHLLQTRRLQRILGIPTSRAVEALAREQGIALTTLDEHPEIDVTIDGADEVDAALRLVKGAGGALLREKIVARASRCEIIVVDESKLVPRVGTRVPLPVEVVPFGWTLTAKALSGLGAEVARRMKGGEPFLTDEGHYIIDCRFGPIEDPAALAAAIKAVPGVVEHGLFLGLADLVIVAGQEGLRLLRAASMGSRGERGQPCAVPSNR